MQLSEIRKELINVASVIVAAGPWVLQAEGVVTLPTGVVAAISLVLGAAGWVIHYFTPNETSDPARVAGRSVRLKGEKPAPSKLGTRSTPSGKG